MLARFAERLAETVNPVMVKEMYQSVHSRRFMAAFWLLLLGALLTYYGAWVPAGRPSDAGAGMFTVFWMLMAAMALFVIPFAAFGSLHGEVTSGTLELVQITGIGARKLVRGRLLAAAVKAALLVSLIAPFAVTSFLFGGLDLAWVLAMVYGLLLASLLACAVGVFCGAIAAYPGLRALAKLAFIALQVFGGISLFALFTDRFLFRSSSIGAPAVAVLNLAWATVLTALGVMFLNACAANALSPESLRSSARGKKIALAAIVALFLWLLTGAIAEGSTDFGEAAVMFSVVSSTFLGLCCLMWIAADPPSPGARPRKPALLPFRDGSSGALVCLLIACTAIGAGVLTFGGLSASPSYRRVEGFELSAYPIGFALAYVPYLAMLARGITRFFPRPYRTAMARRITVIILIAFSLAGLVVMLAVFDPGGTRAKYLNNGLFAFVPPVYLYSLSTSPSVGSFLGHMTGPFLVGVVYHLVLAARRSARDAAPGPKGAGA